MEKSDIYVVIGCLLHDIGKVLYRYDDGRNHAISGEEYLRKNLGIENKEILEQVKYHHAKLLKSSNLPSNSLAYISYIADNIASAADRRKKDEEDKGFIRDIPLDSIFNILNGNSEKKHYKAVFLDSDKIQYPTDETVLYHEGYYSKCLDNIKDALKSIEYTEQYVNSLLEILEGNLSFVPSSTNQKELADISLYDHLKMTAAFGSSIYKYLKNMQTDDYKKELLTNQNDFYKKKSFLLYSMDISGIQDFIYTIKSEGALKNLRARSFYIELLMENMVDELLNYTGYCRTNLIYCGGGHAYLLFDNTSGTADKIRCFERDMNQFFKDNFTTALYLAGGMSPCSSMDLQNNPDGSYREIFQNVSNEISKKKTHRYSKEEILSLNSGIQADCERECKICKRVDLLNKDNVCSICSALESFSSKILNESFFTVLSKNETGDLLPLPNGMFLNAESENELRKRIKEGKNYIRAYCKNEIYSGINVSTKLWVGDYKKLNTFEELADTSLGIKRLGVLRADVDNLGQAFVRGFERDFESEKNENLYSTISRTATFSRKLSIFFKRHINYLLKNGEYHLSEDNDECERNAAIVYSGGDDVFIVGSWDDIIGFAVDLQESLEGFSQGTLTISAGIGIYQPKHPVSAMAREVGELEEYAKALPGKNAVALFDDKSVYSWDVFVNNVLEEKYRTLADFFGKEDQERGKSFLYHLLEYIRNCDEKINIARFAYTLARLEPDKNASDKEKEKYGKFAKTMYSWIQNNDDRNELVTAIYIYAYSVRERQEE